MPQLSRWFVRRAWPVLFTTLLAAGPTEAQDRRILLLQSLDRGHLTLDYLTGNFRVDIDRGAAGSLTFTQVVVNPSGFEIPPEEAIVDYIRASFANRPAPDLVVTIGGPAAAFARKHRQQLFPETPLLLAGFDQRFLQGVPLANDEIAVSVANDIPGIVDDILQLFPQTSTVFVVLGAGNLGSFWRQELERDFGRFRNRIAFIWSNQMSYQEILRGVSTLPPHSAILHVSFGTDGQGGGYSEERVLSDIRAAANAPLFGVQSPQLGHGIVGGHLMPIDQLGHTAADVALQLLNGASPASIRVPVRMPGPPIFDWRELQRWRVSNARLPPNSVVLFQAPSVWQRYRWVIVAAISALVAQTFLITALLVSRVRRRRTEQALRESEGRFRVLANSTPVMVWLAGVDMEATDFNLPWLRFRGRGLESEIGNGWREGVHPEDAAGCVATYRHAFERREPIKSEYRLRRFDGEYRWVLDIGQPRFTPDGSFLGYIGSVVDITDLKAARATLSNLNRRLMEAQEQERARLARELHDDIGQRMTLLSIELEQLRQFLPDAADEARVVVTGLSDEIATLGKDIQGISHRLHSSKLELLGIAAAAGSFCRELASQRGVTIDYMNDNVPVHLPDGAAINLFRVLQEALSNAVKHSGSAHYRVALRGTPDRVTLEVTDNGLGFDIEAARRGQGLGLISMQERLGLVHGDIVIESRPGAGTTVRASVPVHQSPSEFVVA